MMAGARSACDVTLKDIDDWFNIGKVAAKDESEMVSRSSLQERNQPKPRPEIPSRNFIPSYRR